jgi:hypothetical protein
MNKFKFSFIIIIFIIGIIFIILPWTTNIFIQNNLQWISIISALSTTILFLIIMKEYIRLEKLHSTIYASLPKNIDSPTVFDICQEYQLKQLEQSPNVLLYKKNVKYKV